jgi:para-aminobenzoate synthetase/4-amino-4-deoxychorismate lyase
VVHAARFDDLRSAGGEAFALARPLGVIAAERPEEVRPALARVEDAVAAGAWAAGYLAYEAAPGLDPLLRVRPRPAGEPAPPLVSFGLFAERRAESAPAGAAYDLGGWRPSLSRERHAAAVARIHRRIADGDTYQVNHTFHLAGSFTGDPRTLYRDLARAQGGEYSAHLELGRFQVLSASPELFFLLDGDRLTTRPMKGTAPRGRWSAEDRAAGAALAASAKERAENLMIVDLLRNDLGRVATPGSVRVERLFEAERYETVWQLTSTVSSRLVAGTALPDLLAALFPCGSVTGAPKVRTMEIIAALEDVPRGVYTGAVGYLAPPGAAGPRARFAVAIRTLVLDLETGTAHYGVGGGITWDSSAAREYDEALLKARVLEPRPRFDLLETLRWEPERGFPLLAGHLERLIASAGYFGFAADPEEVERRLGEAVAGAGEALRVRLTLARDGRVTVAAAPLPPPPDRPLALAVDPEPVDPADPHLFHKTTRRDPYDRRRDRWPAADDVLLVNDRGEVTESTIANLAARLDGRWVTPPLASGCLPGVYRSALLAAGRLTERALTVADLRRADELALLNAVRLWRPARLLAAADGRPLAGGARSRGA